MRARLWAQITIKFMNNLFADGRWPSPSVLLHASAALSVLKESKGCARSATVQHQGLHLRTQVASYHEELSP
ncbi:hypothetical protein Leryth_027525 [Lithospermum erythrorhizon]|nr:hypothetical protein Leryth_027525 [Lithospermum erythrorhizon]